MKKAEQKTEQKRTAGKPSRTSPGSDELLGLDEIKELIELVSEKQFNEFELERGGFRLRLAWGMRVYEAPAAPTADAGSVVNSSAPGAAAPAAQPVAAAPAVPEPPKESLHLVTSPIVGTFYRSASPTSDPFVDIGDRVSVGKTLCIIEAMKLMNEIQSDAGGEIVKIFVENGQPVEYGQPLFGIRV
jgi:acetyl-CoA carboxylase biotin carboxyl carrier protein